MMAVTARAVVFLCLCLSVCQIRGFQIPLKMNKTIQNLLQHYKIPPKERFNGKPVFTREPLTDKIEAKMVFMGGVLDTYEKLISHMLKQLPTPSPQEAGTHPASAVTPTAGGDAEVGDGGDIRAELSYILKKVQDLKLKGYREQEKLLRGLQALKHIQMDNFVIQSKALWELPWLYEEASTLTENIRMERRRRRRQARRAKTHLRV
ncbi:interferon gamma-like isoform X1 [Micropterus dolomieu]|uniref:interferon gamma-like isoform X1 n=1 Tax=Micropterus dolomieu TaxID=147949 RepID=UPI001E8DA3FE|nr:interferon gamma-like isoform X1 [Micropterus dolomieu]XP_045896221.1 interferon gamma-like isoform X1 [Micropterus dolomieu]